MKKNKTILGLLAMGAMLGSMDNSGDIQEPKSGLWIYGNALDRWAKKKMLEIETRSRDRKANNGIKKPKTKTKKHVFKVTYRKGAKPVFETK